MFGGESFSNTDPASLEADYEKAKSALDDLASKAPDEIKGDVETLSTALATLMDVFASVDYDVTKLAQDPDGCGEAAGLRHPRAQRCERPRRGLPHAGVRDRHDRHHSRSGLSRHSGPLTAAGAPHRSLSYVQTPPSGRLCVLRRRARAPPDRSPCPPASTASGRPRVRGRGTRQIVAGSSIGTLGEGSAQLAAAMAAPSLPMWRW